MPVASPYLTTAEAAEVLRFTGKHAQDTFARYARRAGIPLFKRGRSILVLKTDVVESLRSNRPRLRKSA